MKEKVWELVLSLIDERIHDKINKESFDADIEDMVSEMEDLAIVIEDQILGG